MKNKSRVIKYADLRKQISNMDVYSFEDTPTTKKKLPPNSTHSLNSQPVEKKPSDGIKRNTLSLSIDELVKEHESYSSSSQKKETKNRYRQKRKHENKLSHFSLSTLAWALIVVVSLVVIILVILVLSGVLK